jgi:hypothetical protein
MASDNTTLLSSNFSYYSEQDTCIVTRQKWFVLHLHRTNKSKVLIFLYTLKKKEREIIKQFWFLQILYILCENQRQTKRDKQWRVKNWNPLENVVLLFLYMSPDKQVYL